MKVIRYIEKTVSEALTLNPKIYVAAMCIKWHQNRSKGVEPAPWYQLFNGERINDHLSLVEKQKARESQ